MNERMKKLVDVITTTTVDVPYWLPDYDAGNKEGHAAYKLSSDPMLDAKLRFLSMLNTCKVEPQYYRTEGKMLAEMWSIMDYLFSNGEKLFVAKAICWSRCCGEGMRTINHVAAAMLARYASKHVWAGAFFGPFDKATKTGGCIYRVDDMEAIKDFHMALFGKPLTNAMRRGFRAALLKASAYELLKYKKAVINISNLVHPAPGNGARGLDKANESVYVLDAIMKGKPISAETWEAANTEAGQVVKQAVESGKMTVEEAAVALREAKNDNWEKLLDSGKLGILAALRNVGNILAGGRSSVIDRLCNLVRDGEKIRAGKVMPYQMDFAMTAVCDMGNISGKARVLQALETGMETAVPNLAEKLEGFNCVFLDCSGSMYDRVYQQGSNYRSRATCIDKGAILAAMIAKATSATVVKFGSKADIVSYNPNDSLSTLAKQFKDTTYGGTNISSAFDLIRKEHRSFMRIFIISDNECNQGCTKSAYQRYVSDICNPYVYCIDLAAYGTMPVRQEGKVNYYFGYGYSVMDDIARVEFNAMSKISEVEKYQLMR